MIYTSGSTGKPKGVRVPHRAVVNFLGAMRARPGFGEDDKLVAVTTLSFDIAVLELILPVATGAHVVIATREEATDGEALRRLLEQQHATVMQATPATWRLLIEAGWRGAKDFRALCGGEPLPGELATALVERTGRAVEHVRPDRDHRVVDVRSRDRGPSRSRSARRSRTPRSTCSTRSSSRCRSASSASCSSRAMASRTATSIVPS